MTGNICRTTTAQEKSRGDRSEQGRVERPEADEISKSQKAVLSHSWKTAPAVTNTASAANDLDELIDETVTSTLKQVLGEGPASALMYHIGVKATVSGANAFSQALERILGAGSTIVEKLIVKALYNRIGMKFEEQDRGTFSFEESIWLVREFMVKGGREVP